LKSTSNAHSNAPQDENFHVAATNVVFNSIFFNINSLSYNINSISYTFVSSFI
jgi:hypothetical protein